jgi:hypothetical protein
VSYIDNPVNVVIIVRVIISFPADADADDDAGCTAGVAQLQNRKSTAIIDSTVTYYQTNFGLPAPQIEWS